MFFKKKKQPEQQEASVPDDISLFDADKLIFDIGYKVFKSDEGKKALDKSVKNAVKLV